VSRRIFSDENPAMSLTSALAEQAREQRRPAGADNPFLGLQNLVADSIAQSLDLWRDLRDAAYEHTFISIYGTPWMQWFGKPYASERTRKDPNELRYLPVVQAMLLRIEDGGFEAALIRMLILLADTRGSVRRDRLERSAKVLTSEEPFVSLSADRRATLIHEQSIVVEFEPEQALRSLPHLLPHEDQRRRALDLVHYIVGARSEMEPQSLRLLQTLEELLGQPVSDLEIVAQ
jgi:hypothetical protein